MSRINTNVPAIQAMTRLNKNTSDLSVHIGRLSTGLRINAGKDDPAGLIASENLRSEMAGISQAINNSTRASSVIATAEGALNEVAALLLDVKNLTNASANKGGISAEEIKANQLQIDSAVASINRIANSTVFEGVKLLNGSLDFTTTGVDSTELTDVRIDETRFGTSSSVTVDVTVNTAAEQGKLYWAGAALAASATIEIAGAKGVEVFSFKTGATRNEIADAINQATDVTGIIASSLADTGSGDSGVVFSSQNYGSKQFVSVKPQTGTFATTSNADGSTASNRDAGLDAVVSVNGVTAVADGLKFQINGPTVAFEATLADATVATSTFNITGGGAQFQLGPTINAQQMAIIGLQSVAAHRLGNATDGFLSDIRTGGSLSIINDHAQEADKILADAISQVANLRGRLGAFQKNVLATNINSLNVALENVTASESAIRDADFAQETAAMTRAQILVQAGTNVLAIANTAPQNVLALLG